MNSRRFCCRSIRKMVVLAMLWSVAGISAGAAEPTTPDLAAPDPARVDELADMLGKSPRGVGPTIDDRRAWDAVAKHPLFRDVVARAEQIVKEPIPELTDELFLDYSRTGNRTRCQAVLSRRHARVSHLALAECLENRGRFLKALDESIRAMCSEKTWVMPAHDASLKNFNGEIRQIDLAVASQSWNLATAAYWLGEKLQPETRTLIRDELERRTFVPFESMVTKGEPSMWWLRGTNNWNAVCLAGVTGAALANIESPKRRAFFIASAEKYIEFFLSGFTPDGYCSEGVGYWNYGFGHYVMLAETVHQATGGKVDMMADPRIRSIGSFGRRMEIAPGLYPAFADCSVGSHPDTQLMAFLSRRLGLGLHETESEGLLLADGPTTALFGLGLYGFPNSASRTPTADGPTPEQPPRDWFPDAGVLICRPTSGDSNSLAIALKGGHNAEHHNHNDVGSYLVTLRGKAPLADPGAEVYTARTFSSKRYDSGVLNSLGHPVPRVAGKLQRTGRSAAAKILKTQFTDETDAIVLDLRAAYDVPELKRLERTFLFSRTGRGSLTIVDEVEFDSPQSFATTLITFDRWKRLEGDRLLIGSEGESSVEVDISVEGSAFTIQPEQIDEDVRGGRLPTRLGIELTKPVTRATITMTVTPKAEK